MDPFSEVEINNSFRTNASHVSLASSILPWLCWLDPSGSDRISIVAGI